MIRFKRNRAPLSVWRQPLHFLAFGCGAGAAPYAPGTVGTLPGVALVYLLSFAPLWIYPVVTVLLIVLGFWICGQTAKDIGVHDHSGIVFDEIAGYLVAMSAAPINVTNLFIAFILFRFFDIFKPWPIAWFDRHARGGVGIMLDDVLAGIYTLAVMWLLLWYFPQLGA